MSALSSVFINYRRRDEAYAAALLDEKLSEHFGSDNIFRASRSIAAGADWGISIIRAIERCRVMVVLIGANWTSAFTDGSHGAEDWVRREIVEAFKRDVPVIPILLSGVTRLAEDDVPPDVSWIARSQYLRFDYRNFGQDSHRIAYELRRVVPDLPTSRSRGALARLRSRLSHGS